MHRAFAFRSWAGLQVAEGKLQILSAVRSWEAKTGPCVALGFCFFPFYVFFGGLFATPVCIRAYTKQHECHEMAS